MDSLSESRSVGPRYRVVTELGAGGTADVFLALLDEVGSSPTLCVIKTPRRGLANEEELLKMFRRESRLAARLRHPNIVEVFEILEDRGQPVLVMEFLEGASLRELQRMAQQTGQRLPIREEVKILQEVCHGLHYCHELRDVDGSPMELVHRDVSPHNIFVTFDNQVKVLDFGIAKLSGSDRDTQTGLVKGKLRYMAPEHMMGAEVDRRADVYAMGVLLWEAIAGRLMWEDLNDAVLMQRTVNGDIPDPRPLVEGCTPTLVSITRKALALDPAQRFPSCEALAEALEHAKRELPSSGVTFGEVIGAFFDERRRRLREQVHLVQSASSSPHRSITGPIEWHHGQASAGTVTLGQRSHTSLPTRRSSGVLAAIALGSAALAVMAWFGLQTTQRHTLEGGMQPELANITTQELNVLPLASASIAGDTSIRVAIRVEPEGAELQLDGKRLSPPYELTVPRDTEAHTLLVSAPGYEELEQVVTFDRDLQVSLRLDRRAPSAPTIRRVRRTATIRKADDKPTPERVEKEPAPRGDDCDVPFVLNERGIKRFKRHCL